MSDTTYIDYVQPAVSAEWLNEINDHVWHDTPVMGVTVHDASVIKNTPAGTIASTNIQDAINELDADKLSSLFTQTGTGAIPRSYSSKVGEVVSVKDFGAVGDGITDDAAAIQLAQDSLGTSGGTIFFPPGIYLLRGTYPSSLARVQDGIKVQSNTRFVGAGSSTEIRLDSSCICGFTTRLLSAITDLSQAPKNIEFHNLTLARPGSSWNSATENTGLLEIGAVNGLTVNNCRFVGWPGDAILLGCNNDASVSTVLQTYVQDVRITNCFFDGVNKDNRQAISLLCGVDVHISRNTITRTTRSVSPAMPGAIDIEPILTSAEVANIIIDHNTFDDIGGVTGTVSAALGIPLSMAAHDITISDNTFRRSYNTADIYALGQTSADHTAVAVNSPYNISIHDNVFDPLPNTVLGRRFYVGGVINLSIRNNIIYGGSGSALIGYDDGGSGHYPIKNLSFCGNQINDWSVEGDPTTAPITIFGGILGGDIGDNKVIDSGNLGSGIPVNMVAMSFVGNSAASKNININGNTFINSGAYNASSVTVRAVTLTNPTTFSVKNNTFIGFNNTPYTGSASIYAQAICDLYPGTVTIPSTNTPAVSGAEILVANTGDTFINFARGKEGQRITIIGSSAGAIIQNNANVNLSGSANFTLAADSTITLVNTNSKWYEVCRSVN